MQFFILVILICLFVFLYCVYLLGRDDFIFLRRDVTMERLFNIIFLGSLLCLFFARFFYGFFHSKAIFSNPLVFFLFPYYPGLSLLGGVIGAGVFFLFLSTRKEITLPVFRISDFFSIAFLVSLPLGYLGYFMLSEDNFPIIKAAELSIFYLIIFAIFLKFLLPKLLSGKLKEGTITFLFLTCFSLISLVSNAFPKFSIDYFKNLENILLILIFVLSFGFFVWREGLLLKIEEIKNKK